MAYECKHCDKPNKSGTGKAAHERNCKQNPAHVPSIQERKAQAAAENPHNRCPECEAAGEGRGFNDPGALMGHRVKQHNFVNPFAAKPRRKKMPSTEVVVTNVTNNGTPASVRRSLQMQHRNREDLTKIVQICFPRGIPTEDAEVLDGNLDYISQTARILERRS